MPFESKLFTLANNFLSCTFRNNISFHFCFVSRENKGRNDAKQKKKNAKLSNPIDFNLLSVTQIYKSMLNLIAYRTKND